MATEERETVSLIGSDKVEGTSVYGADETQIGSIERVMIDKRSGKVSYAVLSFGGFLGQRLLRGHPCLSLHSDRKRPASKAGFFVPFKPKTPSTESRWQPTSGRAESYDSPICRRSCKPGSAHETILTLRYATPVEG